jgi:hypothetical protein
MLALINLTRWECPSWDRYVQREQITGIFPTFTFKADFIVMKFLFDSQIRLDGLDLLPLAAT